MTAPWWPVYVIIWHSISCHHIFFDINCHFSWKHTFRKILITCNIKAWLYLDYLKYLQKNYCCPNCNRSAHPDAPNRLQKFVGPDLPQEDKSSPNIEFLGHSTNGFLDFQSLWTSRSRIVWFGWIAHLNIQKIILSNLKWISGENKGNCFHLVEIWNGLFLETSYLVSIVSLGAGRHVYLAMVVGNDKSNNGKTLRSSCYK